MSESERDREYNRCEREVVVHNEGDLQVVHDWW